MTDAPNTDIRVLVVGLGTMGLSHAAPIMRSTASSSPACARIIRRRAPTSPPNFPMRRALTISLMLCRS